MSNRAFLALAATLVGCAPQEQPSQELDAIESWAPAPVREGNLRIATFNIRNFPSVSLLDPTQPADTTPPISYLRDTDRVALLALLETLSFDVLAVQEILDAEALGGLIEELGEKQNRRYAWAFSENAEGNPQHIGIIVDSDKLALEDVGEHTEVNVSGTLRPGLSARITSEGGIDFSVMVLHLASGDSGGRVELRAEQARQTASIVAAQRLERMDDDYLVLGDLNTAKEEDEYPVLDEAFASGDSALTRQQNTDPCTSYWIKRATNPLVRPSTIDHVYAASMAERDVDVPIESGAHCAEYLCQAFESRDAQTGRSFYSVSDHCPVYFEVIDEDRD